MAKDCESGIGGDGVRSNYSHINDLSRASDLSHKLPHKRFYRVRIADLTTMLLLAKNKQDAVEEALRTPSTLKVLEKLCVVTLGEKARRAK